MENAFKEYWKTCVLEVEQSMRSFLPFQNTLEASLHEAMAYGALSGGKRLRPLLVRLFGDLYGVPREQTLRVGTALEFIHVYSLMHDDLPCQDNGQFRHGLPTCHVRFGEATTVIAGTAFIPLAFEILASPETHPSAETRCTLMTALTRASGMFGMMGGQMRDLLGEGQHLPLEEIEKTNHLKTGMLLEFAGEAACILADTPVQDRADILDFCTHFATLFQLTDDLLDAIGDPSTVGKDVGQDVKSRKATVLLHKTPDLLRKEIDDTRQLCMAALDKLPQINTPLEALVEFTAHRAY